MGYVHKKWYKLEISKIKREFKSLYKFEKVKNLPKNYVYNLQNRKISRDNKYFDILENYLVVEEKTTTLTNKKNIISSNELKDYEEKTTKKIIIKLWKSKEMNKYKVGSFELLKYIHYKTFNHLYEFAGKIRTVDISKDNFQFAPIRYIDIAIESVEKMPIDTFDNIIDKYTEMNIIHPFREGNGRTMRLWLNNMLENKIGLIIDWSLINKSDYFNAMIKSHIDTNELKVLLHSALTNKIDDESIFFKGLDNSYNYEEMEEYKSHEL